MRFANAWLTAHEGYLAFAALGSIPERQQLPPFLVATDKPRNPLWPHRLEAALDCSPPSDTASVHRAGNSSKLVPRKILAN
jgi:hypothetical protein